VFIGFVRSDNSGLNLLPSFLNGGGGTYGSGQTTVSVTVNAGDDVYLTVTINNTTNKGVPTSVTWNGLAMTKISDSTTSDRVSSAWGLALGDVASNTTANLTFSGNTAPGISDTGYAYAAYQYVDQSNPYDPAEVQTEGGTSVLTTDPVLTAQGYAKFISVSLSAPTTSGLTTRGTGFGSYIGDIDALTGIQLSSTGSASGDNLFGFALKSAVSASTVDVIYSDIVSGFTGLTPGATYYLSDTNGTISTTPGTTTVRVGKAISATELLIVH